MSVMMPRGHAGEALPAASASAPSMEERHWRRSFTWLKRAVPLLRVLWIACAVFSLYVFVATNPSRARHLQDVFSLNSGAFSQLGFDRETLPLYMILLDSIGFFTYALVGVLIFWRKSTERVAFFASLSLVTAGITIARPTDSLFFVEPALHIPILVLFMLGTGSILFFLYLFPNGHFTPRWIIAPALLLSGFPIVLNLQQIFAAPTSPWPPASLATFAVPSIALAAGAQIYNYRHVASQAQRQQMKWVVYGVMIGTIGLIGFLVIVPALFPQVFQAGMERAIYVLVGVPLFYLALASLPVAIAISIFRYRLWDIDILIRQTLLYGTLTAFVAGLFAAAITLGQKVFMTVTGQRSDIATVLATLLVVALVTPAKDQLQRALDRRLKGGPDPALRLHGFVERVNARVSPVEPHQISRRLVDEGVAAFGALGGAVYFVIDGRLNLVYRTPEWDGDPFLSADLGGDAAHRFAVAALGGRRNGQPYTEGDQKLFQDAATAIAAAIEQDRSPI